MAYIEDIIIDAILAELYTGTLAPDAPTLNVENCNFRPMGKPQPMAPFAYVALDEEGSQILSKQEDNYTDEVLGYSIHVSWRLGVTPVDRNDNAYRDTVHTLDKLTSQIVRALDGNQVIRNAANTAIVLVDPNFQQISTPLMYSGRSKTTVKTSSWSNEDDGSASESSGWLVRRIDFQGFRRIQVKGCYS